MKKKNLGGAKSYFFAQKYQIFSKIDPFFRKIGPSGGHLHPTGYALEEIVNCRLYSKYRRVERPSMSLD